MKMSDVYNLDSRIKTKEDVHRIFEQFEEGAMPTQLFRLYLTDLSAEINKLITTVYTDFFIKKRLNREDFENLLKDTIELYNYVAVKLDEERRQNESLKRFEELYNNFALEKIDVRDVITVARLLLDFLIDKGLIDVLQLKKAETVVDNEF